MKDAIRRALISLFGKKGYEKVKNNSILIEQFVSFTNNRGRREDRVFRIPIQPEDHVEE